jgi:hypothetical protein
VRRNNWFKGLAAIVLTPCIFFEVTFLFFILFVNIITKAEGANDVFVSNFGWALGIGIIILSIIIGRIVTQVETLKWKRFVYALTAFFVAMFISLPLTLMFFSFQMRLPVNVLMNLAFGSYRTFIIYIGLGGTALFIGVATYETRKYIPLAPPPIPKSTLGFSPQQVVADLGQPRKVINLGSKMVYIYKDVKIVFIDGKVVDIQ